jgi:hypothetical protein
MNYFWFKEGPNGYEKTWHCSRQNQARFYTVWSVFEYDCIKDDATAAPGNMRWSFFWHESWGNPNNKENAANQGWRF